MNQNHQKFIILVLYLFPLIIPTVAALGRSKTYLQRRMDEFSVIPFITPDYSKIEDYYDFEKKIYLQVPCSIDNWNPVHPKCNIAYGCILNSFRNIRLSSFGLVKALKYTWGNLTSHPFQSVNDDWSHLKFDDINITFAKGLELRYSPDGRNWTTIQFGYISEDYTPRITYVKFVMGVTYFISFDAFNKEGRLCHHNVTITYDQEEQYNLVGHTYLYHDYIERDLHDLKLSGKTTAPGGIGLRMMTYNAWNTNPPSYIFDAYNRVIRYRKRIELLTYYIRHTNPAILAIQEVRFDESLGKIGDHNEASFLVENLPDYPHYVYQAADIYMKKGKRIEEGMMIFSKYPILSCDYHVLSKFPDEEKDKHQRILLHCIIHLPSIGDIDVYTTHLSLSNTGRERQVMEVTHFMKKDQTGKLVQFLMGDFNGKPFRDSIQYLFGKKELEDLKGDLIDTYSIIHPEEPDNNSTDLFTFESNRPRKRIDYILYRSSCNVTVNDYRVVGQKPAPGTEKRSGNDMVEKNSPLWASDHRGVYVDVQLFNYVTDNWNTYVGHIPNYKGYKLVDGETPDGYL